MESIEDLEQALGVVARNDIKNGQLEAAKLAENLNEGKGIRRAGGFIQLGLTKREIQGGFKRDATFNKEGRIWKDKSLFSLGTNSHQAVSTNLHYSHIHKPL